MLKAINRVRQGHQCNRLSEISTSDGRKIDEIYALNLAYKAIINRYESETR